MDLSLLVISGTCLVAASWTCQAVKLECRSAALIKRAEALAKECQEFTDSWEKSMDV